MWRAYISRYRSQTNHLLVIVVGAVVVVVVVVVVPASPLYSPGGEANPRGGSWDCQLPTGGNSTCQAAGQVAITCHTAGHCQAITCQATRQSTSMLLPHVAHHPAAAPHMTSWLIKVAVADGGHLVVGEPAGGGGGHLVVGRGGEPAGGHRPGKTHSHCLRLLEVGA